MARSNDVIAAVVISLTVVLCATAYGIWRLVHVAGNPADGKKAALPLMDSLRPKQSSRQLTSRYQTADTESLSYDSSNAFSIVDDADGPATRPGGSVHRPPPVPIQHPRPPNPVVIDNLRHGAWLPSRNARVAGAAAAAAVLSGRREGGGRMQRRESPVKKMRMQAPRGITDPGEPPSESSSEARRGPRIRGKRT